MKKCPRFANFSRTILLVSITVLFWATSTTSFGQSSPIHMPLLNPIWRLIAEKTYVVNAQYKKVPIFPEDLIVQINTTVELPGYIIPIKAGLSHEIFMLSILPTQQCPFCGQGDVPSLVEVKMKSAITYSDKPIRIKGRFKLNESGNGDPEILLVDAELIK
ncbi:hypothetical protein [Mucilaginibacter sp. UYCu711]|uniref:hypothetical protein n=1 Tax=Mucilaginibacter sp. UYCu711 TaxID=3156339 RepID=UPI003D235AE8